MTLADLYGSARGQFWIAVATAFVLVTSYTVMGYLYFEDQRRSREDLYAEVEREAAATRREVKAAYERIEIRLQAELDAIGEAVKSASHLEDQKDAYWLKLELEKFDRVLSEIGRLGELIDK